MGELIRNGIFAQFQISPHKVLTNYKGENINFTVEVPCRHTLIEVIKVIIISNETNRNHVLPNRMH